MVDRYGIAGPPADLALQQDWVVDRMGKVGGPGTKAPKPPTLTQLGYQNR